MSQDVDQRLKIKIQRLKIKDIKCSMLYLLRKISGVTLETVLIDFLITVVVRSVSKLV